MESIKSIIFLDIDGVLNDNKSEFLLENIEAVIKLTEKYNAKIVLISSWQMNGTKKIRNRIGKLLEQYNIHNIDFIDPNFEGEMYGIEIPARVLGIVDYLKEKKNCNYVILDDEYHNDYKLLCLNYYKTNPFRGIKSKDLSKISFKPVNLNNFKYLDYHYRELGDYERAYNNLIKVLKKVNSIKKEV